MSPRLMLPLLLALLLASSAPPAHAQEEAQAPPVAAALLEAGNATLAFWTGPDRDTIARELTDETALWLGLSGDAPAAAPENATEENATVEPTVAVVYRAYVNLTGEDALAFEPATLVLEAPADGNWTFDAADLLLAEGAEEGVYAYTVAADVYRVEGENATLLDSVVGEGSVEVEAVAVPPVPVEPGIPTEYLLLGGAAVLVAGGGAAVLVQRRRERARIERMPRRSSVLREEALERAAVKKPEQRAAVEREIRQQEHVRERRRELQILDAKRQDVLKTMDLLKKRREAGGLTEHQYNTMVGKKQADLDRIEQEIAEMEAQDERGGAAA